MIAISPEMSPVPTLKLTGCRVIAPIHPRPSRPSTGRAVWTGLRCGRPCSAGGCRRSAAWGCRSAWWAVRPRSAGSGAGRSSGAALDVLAPMKPPRSVTRSTRREARSMVTSGRAWAWRLGDRALYDRYGRPCHRNAVEADLPVGIGQLAADVVASAWWGSGCQSADTAWPCPLRPGRATGRRRRMPAGPAPCPPARHACCRWRDAGPPGRAATSSCSASRLPATSVPVTGWAA